MEEEWEEDRNALLDGNNVFKTSDCKKGADNTGDRCPAVDGRREKLRGRSIVDNAIEHIKATRDAPQECEPVASSGVVFHFERFLPHIQYGLNLPLTLISPAVAEAQQPQRPSLAVGIEPPSGATSAGPRPQPIEETPPERDLASSCGSCTNIISGQCFVPKGDASCPTGWTANSANTQCYKNCEEGLTVPPTPRPSTGACTSDTECDDDKKCENTQCVDRCIADSTKPQWNGSTCVCEGASCGAGKVCNSSGECENESTSPPDCIDSTKPQWNGSTCVCEGTSCGDGKVCNSSGECENEPTTPPAPFNWCENCDCRYKRYFDDEGNIDIDGLCEDPILIITNTDGDVEESAREDCKDYLQYIEENIKEYVRLKEEFNRLVRKLEREERAGRRLARRCERNPGLEVCQQRAPGMTEAGAFCTSCFQEVIDAAYPKRSTWDKLLSAVVPLAGTGLAYYGIKESNKLRAKQGFPVDNSAMYGLAYPFITQMLYGGALGGRGRNALACSPTAHQNPYGGMLSAYGHLSGMIPGMGPGVHGGFLQGGIPVPGYAGGVFNIGGGSPFFGPGGFGPGASLYANMGLGPGGAGLYGPGGFGPGASLYANMGLLGPGGGAGVFGPGAGVLGPGAGAGLYGPGGAAFNYQSQLQVQMQMQQRMQSYYMQLQQFQMEQERVRQATIMRYQQEAQSLAVKYQTFLTNMSHSGGQYPYPPPPGGNPIPTWENSTLGGNTTSGYQNPYE